MSTTYYSPKPRFSVQVVNIGDLSTELKVLFDGHIKAHVLIENKDVAAFVGVFFDEYKPAAHAYYGGEKLGKVVYIKNYDLAYDETVFSSYGELVTIRKLIGETSTCKQCGAIVRGYRTDLGYNVECASCERKRHNNFGLYILNEELRYHAPKSPADEWTLCIRKWEMLVENPVEDGGTRTCSFCIKYKNRSTGSCTDCPIAQEGHHACRRTPYWKYHRYKSSKSAREELDYLRGLRARTMANFRAD